MTREEVKGIIKKLRDAYGNKIEITNESLNIWCDCLKDCNNKFMPEAVRRYISNNEYPPTIASIMKCYKEVDAEYRDMHRKVMYEYESGIECYLGEKHGKEDFKAFSEYIRTFESYSDKIRAASEFRHQCIAKMRDIEHKASIGENTEVPSLVEFINDLKKKEA